MQMLFDGWAPLIRTLILGTLSYFSLVVLLRVSGKRTLSKMNAFDFIVTVALGSTLASILTSKSVSYVQGVLALSVLIFLQFLMTFLAVRFKSFHRLLKAEPSLLFYRGAFLQDQMRRQRVTEEEILAAMRQQGVSKPDEVDAVVLETEGTLTVLSDGAQSLEKLAELGIQLSKMQTS